MRKGHFGELIRGRPSVEMYHQLRKQIFDSVLEQVSEKTEKQIFDKIWMQSGFRVWKHFWDQDRKVHDEINKKQSL